MPSTSTRTTDAAGTNSNGALDAMGLMDLAIALSLNGVDAADGAAVDAALRAQASSLPLADQTTFMNRGKAKAIADAEANGTPLRSMKIEPERFDFDSPSPRADWIVRGLIERKTVNICSGDTGAAKSIHWQDATVCLVHGDEWLGRETEKSRVLYIDEENPERIVHARLAALGMRNDDHERFRYYRRKGIRVGAGPENRSYVQWLQEECDEFGPDVVVIDTAMAAIAVETLDNDSVVAIYTDVLRPLAEQHNLAVVILHHERKPGAQEKRNAGMAMMGGRQWAGQADVHMTLTATSEYVESELPQGGVETHKEFQFSVAKGRDGHSERPERTTIKGVKQGSDFALVSMGVEWGGRIEIDSAEDETANQILRVMIAEPDRKWMRKDVASALGESKPTNPGGTFTRAWGALRDSGFIQAAGKAAVLTEEGRERAETLGIDLD